MGLVFLVKLMFIIVLILFWLVKVNLFRVIKFLFRVYNFCWGWVSRMGMLIML